MAARRPVPARSGRPPRPSGPSSRRGSQCLELGDGDVAQAAAADGVPKSVITAGTSVSITSRSRSASSATSAATRSLSTTASTPSGRRGPRSTGTPPPPASTTVTPCCSSSSAVVDLDDALGQRRGHDPAPAARRPANVQPCSRASRWPRPRCRPADELGRVAERRVGGVDDGLGHQGDDRRGQAGVGQPAAASSRSYPGSRRRGHRAGRARLSVVSARALQREHADLRPVAVHEDQLVLGRDLRRAPAPPGPRARSGWRRPVARRGAAARCRPGRRRPASLTCPGWRP